MVTFCSVATRETLPQVRVLAEDLHEHEPEARVVVCLTGGSGELTASEPFEIVRRDDLSAAASGTDPGAEPLSAPLLAPALLSWALGQGAEVAVYVEATTAVFAPLTPVLAPARSGGILLVGRARRLPEDGKRPGYAELVLAGSVTTGFVAAAGSEGERFARWWLSGLRQGGHPARWLELAPREFPGIRWVEDPGVALSLWNLHERPLGRGEDGVTAAGARLRSLDLAGFRPDRPYLLSEQATRVNVLADPVLAELCGRYGERVRAAGWRPPADDLTTEERFGNGLPMDALLRELWAQAQAAGEAFGDPASPLAAEAFAVWLQQPAERGGAAGVNRYLHAAYRARPDLQSAFPDLDTDGAALIAWGWEHGRHELGLHAELLPPSADGVEAGDDAHLTVNVVGYLRDTLGIGEAARLYITAMRAARVPVITTAVSPDLPVAETAKRSQRPGQQSLDAAAVPYEPAFNLVCMNGDHLAALMRAGGAEILGDRLTIGHWAWETDVLPPSWQPGFEPVSEIWVNSNFVAERLGRVSPVPVVMIPQAMTVPDVSGVPCELIRGDQFTFLFLFDFFSTIQRKNPLGLIDAFTRAFAPGEGPRLLIKTINERFRPEVAEEVRARIGDRSDIELVDRYLEPVETSALLARADCYVSLHRSEGFGLTLAESMALGTPVIATGYSGNLDFTTDRNSYLVDWAPTPVGPRGDVYPPDGTWAEPDLDHAARLMRHVWEHPDEAAAKAERARIDIERQYAPAVAGAAVRARLEALLEHRRAAPRRQSDGALVAIERELGLDLRQGVPSRRRAASLARRVVMRLMLPFTVHERRLDRAVLAALQELRADLQRERARGARTGARLRRLEQELARAKEPGR